MATIPSSTTRFNVNNPSPPSPHNVGGESSNAASQAGNSEGDQGQHKKKKKRSGKKKRTRRSSFAVPSDMDQEERTASRPLLENLPEMTSQEARDSFYRVGRAAGSNTSLESEALLDHRDSGPLQTRRQSIVQGIIPGRMGQPSPRSQRQQPSWYNGGQQNSGSRLRRVQRASESEDNDDVTDRAPLLGASLKTRFIPNSYGGLAPSPRDERKNPFSARRPSSGGSSRSSKRRKNQQRNQSSDRLDDYDINNPPSMPGSPKFGAEMGFEDVMLTGNELDRGRATDRPSSREVLIDIDENAPIDRLAGQAELSSGDLRRRLAGAAEDDVCFPHEDLTELGEEDAKSEVYQRRRRRRREWPDLDVLQEWAGQEKEQRTLDRLRVRQVSEPVMINGRLRPTKQPWHREEEESPLRFTYFNEDFSSTLHSESLSELVHDDLTFRNLFIPDPPVLSDSSSDEEDNSPLTVQLSRDPSDGIRKLNTLSPPPAGRAPSISGSERPHSRAAQDRKPPVSQIPSTENSNQTTGHNTPTQGSPPKQKRYGNRPIWWLDVLCPTDQEMRVLSKAFGIHPLTAEDVMMREQREKVELFRNYYFVSYRSFEQDSNDDDYLEPVSMYVVVFRDGVISFHFSQTPHPANVRRRIRQLKDYLLLTTDWISYAIIDDVTDSYFPLISQIEEEVDEIDEAILQLHSSGQSDKESSQIIDKMEKKFLGRSYSISQRSTDKASDSGQDETAEAGNMLRHVGECRKKVMGLYRLLGNKADVIKGFAKRCNEQWEIAPRSDIGLYLGDIQDHIVTMTGNLSHYEKYVIIPVHLTFPPQTINQKLMLETASSPVPTATTSPKSTFA
jgi:magnesium transporter